MSVPKGRGHCSITGCENEKYTSQRLFAVCNPYCDTHEKILCVEWVYCEFSECFVWAVRKSLNLEKRSFCALHGGEDYIPRDILY